MMRGGRIVPAAMRAGIVAAHETKAIERFLDAATLLGHPVDVGGSRRGRRPPRDAARAVRCEVGQIVGSRWVFGRATANLV